MSEAPEDLRDLEQMHQDWLNTPTLSAAMQLPEVRVLVGALCGLKRIIEEIDGAMDHGTWRDDKGQRLKDTPEWVAAYIALAPFTEAKP